jgi:hypothetical protein
MGADVLEAFVFQTGNEQGARGLPGARATVRQRKDGTFAFLHTDDIGSGLRRG